MENDSVKQRINGNHMQTFIGQHVIMVGHLINVDSSGRSLKLKCCDDQIILVQLKQPMQEMIENGTMIEVEGKVSSRNAIACNRFTVFNSQLTENFDPKIYCEMANILLSSGAKNNFIIDDLTEHHGSGDTVEILYQEGDIMKHEGMDFQEHSFLTM